MKIVERQWKHGVYLAYEDVEPELMNFVKGSRVLPAPFYYEKRLYFEFIRKWEPGENKLFPNGGYEVYGPNLEVRSYDLDQLVLHPLVIKHAKAIEKTAKRAEKERNKTQKQRDRETKKREEETRVKGKRGRKALSPEEIQLS